MIKSKISELDEPRILTTFGPFYDLRYTPKLSRGTEMIELRVWKKWNTDGLMHPNHKNGLMIEKSKFKEIMPILNEIMSVT